jgi:hypothetical protein
MGLMGYFMQQCVYILIRIYFMSFKLTSLSLFLVILANAFLFSEETAKPAVNAINMEEQAQVLLLLRDKNYQKNSEIAQIKKLTENMPLSYRLALNSSFQTSWAVGVGLNMAFPSVGNWVMGNVAGGIVTSSLYLTGLITGTIGLLQYSRATNFIALFIAGGCAVLEGILNFFLPIAFAADINKKLSQALGLEAISTSSVPLSQTLNQNHTTSAQSLDIGMTLVSVKF